MSHNLKNFSALAVLLSLVIIGIVAFAGWYVLNAKQGSEMTLSQAGKSSDAGTQSNASTVTVTKEVALKAYKNDEYGISFSYPEDWSLGEQLANIGRSSNEGDVAVTSPYGTKVNFNLNQGGKGGDCWDDQANDRTKRTCTTVQYSNIIKLEAGDNSQNLFYYNVKVTDSDIRGGRVHYEIGLADEAFGELPTTPTLTAVYVSNVHAKQLSGNVTTSVSGKDDAKKDLPSYFETRQVKEAALILKSVKLAK